MAAKDNTKNNINLMLVREEIWRLEDQVGIFLESVTEHEAELLRMRRHITLLQQRIDNLESRLSARQNHKSK